MKKNANSPLRYPGGKSKLYNEMKEILEYNNLIGCTYIEPFAGGSGLALSLLYNDLVSDIIINDSDRAIYAFWHSILVHNKKFCQKILDTDVTLEEWYRQKEIYNNPKSKIFDLGFATFFLNRTNRSGIIKGGPIGGINQNGKYLIDCRFNKEDLINRIKKIYLYKAHINLYNLDVTNFIIDELPNLDLNNSFIYFDPPYVEKGPELYQNNFTKENHKTLKNTIKDNVTIPWLITYDYTDTIIDIYKEYNTDKLTLTYTAGTSKKGNELMIFSNNLKNPRT